MAVHVVIKRKFQIKSPQQLIPLLSQLRDRAQTQKGYISTETLQSTENPEDFLVVSKWETTDDWQNWFTSKERRDLQGRVDSLIGERTFYEVFETIS